MFKVSRICLFLSLLMVGKLFALTNINISVINKKGMDHQFELVDELHSVELFEPEKPIRLKMNNGLEVHLKLKYETSVGNESAYFNLEGEVVRPDGSLISTFNENPVKLTYTAPLVFIIKDGNKQIVEVTIKAVEIKATKK